MNTCRDTHWLSDRRGFLQQTAAGFGWLALTGIHAQGTAAEKAAHQSPPAPKPPHFPPRAKRVIFLFMNGGPSHLETFDWKPELARAGGSGKGKYLAPAFRFQPSGKSGLMVCDAF